MVTFKCNGLVLTLPSPKDGDTEDVKLRTKIYRTMDGSVYSYKSTPNQSVFNLTFANIARSVVLQVVAFIKATGGLNNIIYQDYNGDTWEGSILNQPFESNDVGRFNSTFNIQFEGFSV